MTAATEKFNADIVILGAGIGGFETFRTLSKLLKRQHLNKKILIIDQNNYFTFVPMLHEVVSGSIEPSHATIPLRELTAGTPHSFLKTKVKNIDPAKKTITTERGQINYTYCVLALGSGVNYYGIPGAERHCYNVRSLAGALQLQEDFIQQFESADKKITLTIVGGGATGVEVAGQFGCLFRRHLKKLYPGKKIEVTLVQNDKTLVPQLPKRAQTKIYKRLKKEGINVLLNTAVEEVTATSVKMNGGKTTESDLTIWAAGLKNIADSFFNKEYTYKSCLVVNNYLQSLNSSELYAIGDIAHCQSAPGGQGYPALGEIAHKQGEYVAKDIVKKIQKKTTKVFTYKSKGVILPIGDWYGVGVFGNLVVTGKFVWWLRRTVYLVFMPGFFRKLKICFDWTLQIFGVRYIINLERTKRFNSATLTKD